MSPCSLNPFRRCNLVERWILVFMVVLMTHSLFTQAAPPTSMPAPPDDAFVHVAPDGHLMQGGQRQRYWGFIGFIAGDAGCIPGDDAPTLARKVAKRRADVDLMVQRIDDLGFNLIRSWEGTFSAGPTGLPPFIAQRDYTPGDGSNADMIAYYFSQLDRRGIKIWMSSMNSLGTVSPDDAAIIADPATEANWKAALQTEAKKHGGRIPLRSDFGNLVRYFDPRVEALILTRYAQAASFPNRYKNGLPLADDPQIVVWEQTNEEFPFRAFFNGYWQNLPPFFKDELLNRWQTFLHDKYKTDAALLKAWRFLLPGESIEGNGSVVLAPLANPVNAAAAVNDTNPEVLKRMRALKQQYSRADFVEQRGQDVVEFFTSLMAAHKQRFTAAIHAMGKSCRFAPCVQDSGNPYQIQSSYLAQLGGVTSTCTYVKGMGYDPTTERYPFYSALEAPPRLCWDVPWVEQSKMIGLPSLIYETQIDTRTKYRAEYPWRIAAAMAIQDMDIVCWHAYSNGKDSANPHPFDEPLGIWHDYLQYSGDEVQLSAMKAAAQVFIHSSLKAPAHPTVITFGRRSLYDPASMDYGRSFGDLGKSIVPTCYRYGVRLKIDPTRDDDHVDGPTIRPDVYEPNPVCPTDQIQYDWQRGHLLLDSPAASAYVGFFAKLGKSTITLPNSDVRFSQVTIVNPPGTPYPVKEDEQYVSLAVVSRDGLPLAQCSRALISAVSTSFNTGYKLDLTKSSKGMRQDGPDNTPPKEFWGAWPSEPGTTPVLVSRVGVTVQCPGLAGMHYTFRDWNMQPLDSGVIKEGKLVIPADRPIFIVECTR